MPTTHCPHCGFNNPPGMRFCGQCGTRLPEEVRPKEAGGPLANLGALMGSNLAERFQQAGLEGAGQRRSVTVMFVDLSNYTRISAQLEDEEIYHITQEYLQTLAEKVYSYEGIVDKFTGDGLMALFGAPIAYENNVERAVRAAVDMQAGLQSLRDDVSSRLAIELKMRIGLHAGSVIAGKLGSNLMMDYTAVGDTVNLASRIEEVAEPGTILVSEAIYRQTKALFEYEKMPPRYFKGIVDEINTYRVLGPKTIPGSVRGLEGLRAPMIGRDAELARLRQVVHALATGQRGHFVLLTGEAGLGKSRLTEELSGQVNTGMISILEGQSLTYRQSISYWIFLDMLRNYLGVTPNTPEAETRQKLAARLTATMGSSAAEVLPFLEYLLSLTLSDPAANERISYLDAEQLRQQIFLALRDLLVAEARKRPLLLILEDLHWVDETSLNLIQFLLDSVRHAPLVLYGISRPTQGTPLEGVIERARTRLPDRFTLIELQTLSPDQSTRLFFELLATPEMPSSFRALIIQRAAGNPCYLEEILRMLIEAHVIERAQGHWRLVEDANISNLGVPETLQGLILTRFDRLSASQRRILQVACVIGREFSVPVLSAVLRDQIEADQVRRDLEVLIAREFVIPKPHISPNDFVFRHVLTSDAIYSTLLKRDLSYMHGMVAAAIEEVYADRLDGQVELLANHYLQSPWLDRALHYLILAGQKASRDYANEQARKHFERALGLLPKVSATPDQVLQIHTGLGDILALTGSYPLARTQFQAALEVIAGFPTGYEQKQSALSRKIALTFERQGDYEKALDYLQLAQNALEEAPGSMAVERAQILNDIGWTHFRCGRSDAAAACFDQALEFVEHTSQYDIIASIFNRLGGLSYRAGNLAQASEYTRKSLALREEIGDIVGMARSYNNLGLLASHLGDWDSALQNYKKVLELQTRIGDVEALAISYLNIATLQVDLGAFADAAVNLTHSMEAAQQTGALFHVAVAQMTFGRLALSQDDPVSAVERLNASLEIFLKLGVQEDLVDVYHLLGEASLSVGDLETAEAWAQRSIELITSMDTRAIGKSEQHGRALRLLGKISSLREDWPAANSYFRASEKLFKLIESRIELGRTLQELGRVALAQNDYAAAGPLLEEAVRIFSALGAQFDKNQAMLLVQALG